MSQARSAGTVPYWLGQEFEAGGVSFTASGAAEAEGSGADVSLGFEYGGDIGNGFVLLLMDSYAPGAGSLPERLSRALSLPHASSEPVTVGNWEGTLIVIPSPTRPFGTLLLVVRTQDAGVVAMAKAGSTGVPGTDVNPLIDKDLLIQVVAENLQPIPE